MIKRIKISALKKWNYFCIENYRFLHWISGQCIENFLMRKRRDWKQMCYKMSWRKCAFISRSLCFVFWRELQKDLLKGTFQHEIMCMWKSCIFEASFWTGSWFYFLLSFFSQGTSFSAQSKADPIAFVGSDVGRQTVILSFM